MQAAHSFNTASQHGATTQKATKRTEYRTLSSTLTQQTGNTCLQPATTLRRLRKTHKILCNCWAPHPTDPAEGLVALNTAYSVHRDELVTHVTSTNALCYNPRLQSCAQLLHVSTILSLHLHGTNSKIPLQYTAVI